MHVPIQPTTPSTLASWIAGTFHGLTWRRLAVLSVAVLPMALSEGAAMLAFTSAANWLDKGLGLVKPWLYVLLVFAPVLAAVIAVENRGPRAGSGRVAALALAVLVGQAIGTVLWVAATGVLYPDGYLTGWFGPARSTEDLIRYFGGNAIMFAGVSATAVTFWYFQKRDSDSSAALHAAREDREEAERERLEARHQAMQAQIEPHFLFNTLASVRRLYETDASSGRTMLRHLTQYLTASLPILRESRSTLGRELELATAYLTVQKIRMGARLQFDTDMPAPLRDVELPPMMLATLVENAVIHGLSPLPQGGSISIVAREDRGRLVVHVRDTGRGLHGAWGGGVGLANITSRLATEFGSAAALELTDVAGSGVTASLTMPLRQLATATAVQ
jgi:signal transduction histidine kinase